jgi:hypothetical protein
MRIAPAEEALHPLVAWSSAPLLQDPDINFYHIFTKVVVSISVAIVADLDVTKPDKDPEMY